MFFRITSVLYAITIIVGSLYLIGTGELMFAARDAAINTTPLNQEHSRRYKVLSFIATLQILSGVIGIIFLIAGLAF